LIAWLGPGGAGPGGCGEESGALRMWGGGWGHPMGVGPCGCGGDWSEWYALGARWWWVWDGDLGAIGFVSSSWYNKSECENVTIAALHVPPSNDGSTVHGVLTPRLPSSSEATARETHCATKWCPADRSHLSHFSLHGEDLLLRTTYYISFRGSLGLDANLGSGGFDAASSLYGDTVYIHAYANDTGWASLIDNSRWVGTLDDAGSTWTGTSVTVRLVSKSSDDATVEMCSLFASDPTTTTTSGSNTIASTTTTSDDTPLSTWAIVGISVGGFALVTIAIAVSRTQTNEPVRLGDGEDQPLMNRQDMQLFLDPD